MNSNSLSTQNVASVNGGRKDLPTASTRVTPEELHLIDAAAYKLRIKRATLIYEATMARVREVLGLKDHQVSIPS